MNKKIGLLFFCTLFLVTALVCVPLTLAQIRWDYCKVDAYGTNLNDYSDSTTNTERFSFTVATPPAGSEITNTIEVRNNDGSGNFTETLEFGQTILVDYLNSVPSRNNVDPAAESNYFIIDYEGEVSSVTINSVDIPEFSTILIVPMFIAATLLAMVYRRKRTSQNQTTD